MSARIEIIPELRIVVRVYDGSRLVRSYVMNHDDAEQRRVLGEQCRNAFEGGQRVVTYPVRRPDGES